MGGRGVSSSNTSVNAGNARVEANRNFRANRILSTADTKGAVRFQLEGNATSFRMTKNNDNTYTMKAGNRVYGRNMTAERVREVIRETQERFDRINKKIKR